MTDTASSSLATSRLGFIVAFCVTVLIAVAALVPQGSAVVFSMAISEGVPLIAWLMAAYGFGSLLRRVQLVAPWSSARVETVQQVAPHLALVTRIAIGLGVISLLTLLLGSIGLLTRATAIFIVIAGDLLAFAHTYTNRTLLADWCRARAGAAWLLLLIVPTFAVTLIGGCVLPGVLWGMDDPAGYDVVAYHLQMPREWYEGGRITTLPHNVFSFFPLNVEMHYLLAMHLRGGAWAGMYLAQLMHGTFIVLTIAAVYAAARERGQLAACVGAIVCASVPWMPMLGSVAYNEGALMLYATLAAAWAMRGRWAMAGVCAGLAAGSKLTGVTSAIVLVPLVIGSLYFFLRAAVPAASAVPEVPPQRHGVTPSTMGVLARGLVAFGLLALLVFSPWLIRTAIASGGNPIFPLAPRVLGSANFDLGQIERFDVAHAPRPDQQSLGGRASALWQQVIGDYHFGTADLSVAVPLWLALIVPALLLARRDREAWIWIGLIVGNVVIWLSATHLQGRFLVQIVPCVAMLVACGVGRRNERGESARLSGLFAAVAIVVCMASFALSMRKPLSTLLAPGPMATLGAQHVDELRQLLPEDVAAAVYDSDRPLVLIGEAKAFWYAIPSSRLRYRSVFDVASAKSFRDAWLGDGVPDDSLVIIHPSELARFARTYRNLPAVPEAWRDRVEPFVVRAADVPR